jgi:hypothetical protein
MVFLQDRTLLRASCHESYRVSKWGAADDRIRWIEETIPIEAVLSMPNDNELRLQLVGQDKVHVYVPASAPLTCPQSR